MHNVDDSQFMCMCKPLNVNEGMVGLAPKWVRLAPTGTNPGLFQITFQCQNFWPKSYIHAQKQHAKLSQITERIYTAQKKMATRVYMHFLFTILSINKLQNE